MKFQITLIRESTDVLSAQVTVEAATKELAEAKALRLAEEEKLEFSFDQCGDCGSPQLYETICLDEEIET